MDRPSQLLAAACLAALALGLAPGGRAAGAPSEGADDPSAEPTFAPEALAFFETRVRPLLSEHCFACHGPERERVKGGLRMSGRAAFLAGGESGPALVPGDPDASELVLRVRYQDAELGMPPKEKLDDESVRVLEQWVAAGAPWPASEGTAPAEPGPEAGIDYAAGREWWSFRPVEAPPVPALPDGAEIQDPIDAFVLARLAEAGLAPAPRASDRELARRAYVDLIGLPPTQAELDAYAADQDPDKWAKLVERLLADPAYGERLARMWLDLVRYAETNGYERDAAKPYAWRYRDWVVHAFNEDLPFDDFLAWQIAGDELEPVTPQKLIATGFYRIGPWDDEPDDPEQAIYDELDDVVRTISEGFLGLTVGCARCHDHKFDPIAQEDYTAMVAFVKNVRPYENPRFALDSATLRLLDTSPAAFARWERQRRAQIGELQAQMAALTRKGRESLLAERLAAAPAGLRDAALCTEAQRTPAQRELLRKHPELLIGDAQAEQALERSDLRTLAQARADAEGLRESCEADMPWALCVREKGPELEPAHLLVRGNATSPAQVVAPHFPRVLAPDGAVPSFAPVASAVAGPRGPGAAGPGAGVPRAAVVESSGARSALARWVASADNPLTARVIVNRVWQKHFGRGLVPTPNDFGRAGQPPSHPELLDFLAARFVADGWSLKALHRQILSSATWQRSSRATNAEALALDPGNELLWRQNASRLEAEVLRDALLSVSGELAREPRGGPSFFPRLSGPELAGASRPGAGWGFSSAEDSARRSLYAHVKRTLLVPFFVTFDYTEVSLPIGSRLSTNLATQSMTLLNGAFANERAAAMAARIAGELGPEAALAAQVERAFGLVLARAPSTAERALAAEYLAATAEDLAALAPAAAFQWRVPPRLAVDFLEAASGSDLLWGPRAGWRYLRGLWATGYNGTLTFDPDRGPSALFEAAPFADAEIELELELERGARCVGLALRAVPAEGADEVWSGLELRFLPAEGRLELAHVAQAEVAVLAEAPLAAFGEAPLPVRIELAGKALEVWIGGAAEPALRADVSSVPGPGCFGVRTQGEFAALARASLQAGGVSHALVADDPGPPERRALESLCLSLFNSNEFLYVD